MSMRPCLKSHVAALREGLGFDRCAVAVVTTAAAATTGLNYITTVRTWRCSTRDGQNVAPTPVTQLNVADAIVTGWRRIAPRQDLCHRPPPPADGDDAQGSDGVVDGPMLVAAEGCASSALRCKASADARRSSVFKSTTPYAAVAAAGRSTRAGTIKAVAWPAS
jgi:cyanophycin synthetase